MLDQAHDLRRLAVHRRRAASPPRVGRPALLAVAGGKGGVGTTTIGLNLAIAVAKTGRRTIFVDADSRGADAALLCGVEERYTLADVLAGRRTWDEALQVGPSGVGLVAAGCGWDEQSGGYASVADQLFETLGNGRLEADLAVIDVGNSLRGAAPHICRRVDAVLMITTPTATAVVNTYAAIKTLTAKATGGGPTEKPVSRPCLLVNMTPSVGAANTVHRRLARASRRLLGHQLRSAGHLAAAEGQSEQFDLNLRALSVDTIGELLLAESLLNWRRRAEFDSRPSGAIAEPLEMDF